MGAALVAVALLLGACSGDDGGDGDGDAGGTTTTASPSTVANNSPGGDPDLLPEEGACSLLEDDEVADLLGGPAEVTPAADVEPDSPMPYTFCRWDFLGRATIDASIYGSPERYLRRREHLQDGDGAPGIEDIEDLGDEAFVSVGEDGVQQVTALLDERTVEVSYQRADGVSLEDVVELTRTVIERA